MRSALLLHSLDNVAIALSDLHSKEVIQIQGKPSQTIELMNPIPRMHKIALNHIAQGQPILRYGQPIGFASESIQAGEHIHSHNCVMGEFDKDYGFCSRAASNPLPNTAPKMTFKGYQRENGLVGTRNYVGILTSVNCSATVAKHIAAHFSKDTLAAYPNIDGVIALTHSTGCGMRGDDEGYATLQRTFEGYLHHPNFAAVLFIGLGCETMQVEKVMQDAQIVGPRLTTFTIQEMGGTRKAIEHGIDQVNQILSFANEQHRVDCPISELSLAVQCGGSDGFSGITANPALGVAADLLIQHGGTVIYSETPEIYGAEHLLTQRAQTPEVAKKLLQRIRWWEDYTRQHGFELDNNPSPGNKAGGLTTIIEKSLGAQAKSGSSPLMEVVLYGERPSCKGLIFMDSPGYDPVSVTGQVASGANIICFTTGRGSAFGFKPVPSIKLASNSEMYAHMEEDMDIDCGTLILGSDSMASKGREILTKIIATASGEPSKSEALGYGDAEFSPWKIGAVM